MTILKFMVWLVQRGEDRWVNDDRSVAGMPTAHMGEGSQSCAVAGRAGELGWPRRETGVRD